MRVVSVNVGMPREVLWKSTKVQTSIFKAPVSGPVNIKKFNLDGDKQADLSVHGGRDKAVYGYPSENYEYWQKDLPETEFTWGKFGENLTTMGFSEESLCIGDQLRVGSATLMVTQPRLPCYKLTIRFQRDDMIKRFLHSGKSGFYFSVLEEGEVSEGAPIEILSRDADAISVAEINRLYFSKNPDPELLQRATRLRALPVSWRDDLAMRAEVR